MSLKTEEKPENLELKLAAEASKFAMIQSSFHGQTVTEEEMMRTEVGQLRFNIAKKPNGNFNVYEGKLIPRNGGPEPLYGFGIGYECLKCDEIMRGGPRLAIEDYGIAAYCHSCDEKLK